MEVAVNFPPELIVDDDLDPAVKFQLLMDAVDKILLRKSSNLSYVLCYSYCYNCVISHLGSRINSSLISVFENHFNQRIRSKIVENLHKKDLKTFIEEWDINFVAAKKIKDVMQFYDNNYIIGNENLRPVFDSIMLSFRNLILENNELIESMQNIIFTLIRSERDNNQIQHRDTIKRIIDFLLNVKLNSDYDNRFEDYERYFENRFIKESKEYYDGLGQSQLTKNDAIKYIELYKLKAKHEKERIELYLHQRTDKKIIKVVVDELIGSKLSKICSLEKGLNWMLDNSCKAELKLIYEWHVKYDNLKSFEDIIGLRYLFLSINILKPENIKNQHQAAKALFDLYDKFVDFCNGCWDENVNIKNVLKENCKTALNENIRSPQILANFIHEQIKYMRKNYTDNDINKELEKFMNYFKLLENKDDFQRFYENHLTSRLIMKKADMDLEKKLAQKLQLECGSYYVKKINDKLMDIVINEEHMKLYYDDQNFKAQDDFNLLQSFDFTILILREFAWSFPEKPRIILPVNLQLSYDSYVNFYLGVHTGRKITLQPNKGSAVLKASYPKMLSSNLKKLEPRSYNLDTSPLQMFVLLQFNEADCLTFEEIHANTNMDTEDLQLVIESLVSANLIKSSDKKDTYLINLEYSSKNARCRLKPENRQNDRRRVIDKIDVDNEADRKLKIQAATVRVMKRHNRLQHSNLVAAVIEALQGNCNPNVNAIEQCFMILIDKEYIKRDEADKSFYIYIS